ncbi:MAG: hypothetical protein JSV30_06320 [Candidatus Omnitrophota bacterium]|nr:MAG: hypothetical protein JSV30_06320 [Candidatus Omnitrophota bacterium]
MGIRVWHCEEGKGGVKRFNFIFLLLAIACMQGCGYTAGSLLPSHIKTIHIRPFRNKIELTGELRQEEYRFRSYRTHLETDITKEVISRFINDGHLQVIDEKNADVVLEGELIDYLSQPVRYGSDNETVEEYRISIVCSVKLNDIKENKLMWQESRIIGDTTYSDSDQSQARGYYTSESTAVSSAVSDLARRIVNRTIEGW